MTIYNQTMITLSRIHAFLTQRLDNTSPRIIRNFGIFGAINYPLFYLVWRFIFPTGYDSLGMRLTATILCIILLLRTYWPKKLEKYLAEYWYLTLLYCLPVFGTFMLLQNYHSSSWLTNSMLTLFLLILVVDWVIFAALVVIGIFLGCALYYYDVGNFAGIDNYGALLTNYIFTIMLGMIFSRDNTEFIKVKFKAVTAMGASIAHELRTPLAAIEGSLVGIKRYLPDLIASYELAKTAKLPVPSISSFHQDLLKETIDDVIAETHYANVVIDMLLLKASQMEIKPGQNELYPVKTCIEDALQRYPLLPIEKNIIHISYEHSFTIKCNKVLFEHVLFNLLKNSLYAIRAAQKGEITIWCDSTSHKHKLHFKDTGLGINKKLKKQLFKQFFTNTLHGTGLGLAFCRAVMTSLGGDIICESEEGVFTEFILIFPREE